MARPQARAPRRRNARGWVASRDWRIPIDPYTPPSADLEPSSAPLEPKDPLAFPIEIEPAGWLVRRRVEATAEGLLLARVVASFGFLTAPFQVELEGEELRFVRERSLQAHAPYRLSDPDDERVHATLRPFASGCLTLSPRWRAEGIGESALILRRRYFASAPTDWDLASGDPSPRSWIQFEIGRARDRPLQPEPLYFTERTGWTSVRLHARDLPRTPAEDRLALLLVLLLQGIRVLRSG